MDEKNKVKKKYQYYNVKVGVNKKEYTLLEEVLGDSLVSTQIRDMFLNSETISYYQIPKINRSLNREVVMIQNNVNQLSRAINENVGKAREDELLYSMDLLANITDMVEEIFQVNFTKINSKRAFKKLLSTQPLSQLNLLGRDGNKNKEIKICFNQEQYNLLQLRLEEFESKPIARILREYVMHQAYLIQVGIPVINYQLLSELNTAGTILNYVAKAVNERRKAGVSLVLASVIKGLEAVEKQITIIYTRECSI